MHEQLNLSDNDRKLYYRDKWLRSLVSNAKKCARSYAKHVLATAEGQMIRPSQIPLTLQGTIHSMGTYGVKAELREYAAKLALRLIKEKGGN